MYRHLYIDLAAGRAEQGFRAFMADFVIDFGPIESGATSKPAPRQAMTANIDPEMQDLIASSVPETRRTPEFPIASIHPPSR